MKDLLLKIGSFLCVALVMVLPLMANDIDFDAQAAGNGGNIAGIPDSPVIIGIATFTSGELLSGEVGLNADQTGVYATEGLFGSGETNPLVITFAVPVSGFSVFVVNADDQQRYTVSDNLGDSVTMSLGSAAELGAAIFSLSGNDVRSVDITSSDANAWNFAIDNVIFTPATPTPEPRSLLLLGGSCVLMGALHRKELAAWLRLK